MVRVGDAGGGAPSDFNVRATVGPEEARIEVSGELDAYSAPQLRSLVDELVDRPAVEMVIDLRHTSFIDSTGLGVLVSAARKVRSEGGELSIDSPTPAVYRTLQMTGLSLTIAIHNAPADGDDHEIPQ